MADAYDNVLDRLFRRETLAAAGRAQNTELLTQPPRPPSGLVGTINWEAVGTLPRPPTTSERITAPQPDYMQHFDEIMNLGAESVVSERVTALEPGNLSEFQPERPEEVPPAAPISEQELRRRMAILKQVSIYPQTAEMQVLAAFSKWYENPVVVPDIIKKIIGIKAQTLSPAEVMKNLDPLFFAIPGGIALKNTAGALRDAAKAAEKAGKAYQAISLIAKSEAGFIRLGGEAEKAVTETLKSMSVADRAALAMQAGLEGKVGSKAIEGLTKDELSAMSSVLEKQGKIILPKAEVKPTTPLPEAKSTTTPPEAIVGQGVEAAGVKGGDWVTLSHQDERGFSRANFYRTEAQAQKGVDALKRKYDFYDTQVVKERDGVFRVQYRKNAEILAQEAKTPVGAAEVPSVTTAPPTTVAVPPDTPLGKIQTMLESQPEKIHNWGDTYLKAQEQLNDSYYGLRRLQTQVGKAKPIKAGSALDITTAITRAPGAANAGLARYEIAIARMQKLAPNANVTDINTILFAEHGKEVLVEKGAERVLAGGVNTTAELGEALKALKTKLGDAEYEKVYAAAKVVKDTYAAERLRLVDSGLISKELGDTLATKYPWYNPMRYLDYAEAEAAMGKRVKPFSVWFSGVKRLSNVGSEGAIQNPVTQLSQELIRNEVRIQKNDLAKGIIALASKDKKLGISKHGEIPGTLSYFKDGIRQVYKVPDWMYREAVVLNQSVANPAVSVIGAMNGITRAAFTSVSPVFTIANIFNDMLPAFIRGGVTPLHTAKRWMFSFHSLENDSLMQAYKLSGAFQARFYGKEAAQIAEEVGATGGKVIGKNFNFKKAIFDAIPNLGQRGEQASREAIFEKALSKSLPNWRTMAIEELAKTPEARKAAADAVEGTINFGRGGYLIRSANPLVLFLNANFEGV